MADFDQTSKKIKIKKNKKSVSFSELPHDFGYSQLSWKARKNKLSHDVRLLVFPASSLARHAATVAFLVVFGCSSSL